MFSLTMGTLARPAPGWAATSKKNNKMAVHTASVRDRPLTHRNSLLFTTSILLAVATAATVTTAQRAKGPPVAANPAYLEMLSASRRHPRERSMGAVVDRSGELYPTRAAPPEGDEEELETTVNTEFEDPIGTASKMPAMLHTTEEQEEHNEDSQGTTRTSPRAYSRIRRPLSSALAAVTLARAAVAAALATAVALLGLHMYKARSGTPLPRVVPSAVDLDSSKEKPRLKFLSTANDRNQAVRGRLLAMLPVIVAGVSLLGAGLLFAFFQSSAARGAATGLNPNVSPGLTTTVDTVLPPPGHTTSAVTDTTMNQRRL